MASHFTPETMRFLRGLAKNNDRVWFEDRRRTYETAVKAPLHALVDEINLAMDGFAPDHIRPAHKTALRIFRDVRFSPDKRPYKTNMAAWWARHGTDKNSGAGFYLQIAPEASFVAAGVYAPEREAMLRLRQWLAEHHEAYRAALAPLLQGKGKLPAMAIMESHSLTRNPKGFAPEHPAGDLLRARNWGVTLALPPDAALTPDLGEIVAGHFRRMATVVHLLNDALAGSKAKAGVPASTLA